MKNIIPLSISILLYLGCFFTAQAADPLSDGDIQSFMNAMKPLEGLGEKYDIGNNKGIPPESNDFADFSPMSTALKGIKGNEAYEEFEKIIRNAGFSSPEQWATVGDRIMRTYMSAKITQGTTPEKTQKMLKSIEEVEKNEYLSPEIKQQLLKSLTQAITMAENLPEQTKADQETLKPYLAKLDRLFEERQ